MSRKPPQRRATACSACATDADAQYSRRHPGFLSVATAGAQAHERAGEGRAGRRGRDRRWSIEATAGGRKTRRVVQLLPEGSDRVILAINKTDTIAEREKLLPLLAEVDGPLSSSMRSSRQRREEAPARRPAEGGRFAAARRAPSGCSRPTRTPIAVRLVPGGGAGARRSLPAAGRRTAVWDRGDHRPAKPTTVPTSSPRSWSIARHKLIVIGKEAPSLREISRLARANIAETPQAGPPRGLGAREEGLERRCTRPSTSATTDALGGAVKARHPQARHRRPRHHQPGASCCTAIRGGRPASWSSSSAAISGAWPWSRVAPAGPTSYFRGLLSLFNLLAVGWTGRNDIKMPGSRGVVAACSRCAATCCWRCSTRTEPPVRLLARLDPHERLFGSYVEVLQALSHDTRHATALRVFELEPPHRTSGYAVLVDRCADGEPIDPGRSTCSAWGRRRAAAGTRRCRRRQPGVGTHLLAMAARRFDDERVAAEAKGAWRRADPLPSRRQAAQYAAHPAGPQAALAADPTHHDCPERQPEQGGPQHAFHRHPA